MYNTDIPARAELPSSRQLLRSTLIAILAAIVILLTIVLPAEYALDPTGIGRLLRLTEMGEIKLQLAAEAAADRKRDEERRGQQGSPSGAKSEQRSSIMDTLRALLVAPAQAGDRVFIAQAASRSDETVFKLRPAEGAEWKMSMAKGARVQYSWKAEGGAVNYDMHGTPGGNAKETSYKSARGVPGDEGVLAAGFDGKHGWFWRNRSTQEVTITLRTSGSYADLAKVK